jgi:hypothetical protein
MDPSDANSWPLRSPGILSRRAPCGFFPLGRQLLDQPSNRMRNPSHQLNPRSWSKGHARLGDRLHLRLFSLADFPPLACRGGQAPRDCGRIARFARSSSSGGMRSVLRNARGTGYPQRDRRLELPFLRHVAQIVIVRRTPIRPFSRERPSCRPVWNVPPQSAASGQ